jgi:hypothetical protein
MLTRLATLLLPRPSRLQLLVGGQIHMFCCSAKELFLFGFDLTTTGLLAGVGFPVRE